jgi:hypothetical protein
VSISAFLETKAASASSFDFVAGLRTLVLIIGSPLDREPDECSVSDD